MKTPFRKAAAFAGTLLYAAPVVADPAPSIASSTPDGKSVFVTLYNPQDGSLDGALYVNCKKSSLKLMLEIEDDTGLGPGGSIYYSIDDKGERSYTSTGLQSIHATWLADVARDFISAKTFCKADNKPNKKSVTDALRNVIERFVSPIQFRL